MHLFVHVSCILCMCHASVCVCVMHLFVYVSCILFFYVSCTLFVYVSCILFAYVSEYLRLSEHGRDGGCVKVNAYVRACTCVPTYVFVCVSVLVLLDVHVRRCACALQGSPTTHVAACILHCTYKQ